MSDDVDLEEEMYESMCSTSSLNSSHYETPMNSPCKSNRSLLDDSSLVSTTINGLEDSESEPCIRHARETLSEMIQQYHRAPSADSTRTLVPSTPVRNTTTTNPFLSSPTILYRNEFQTSYRKIVNNLKQINTELHNIDLYEQQLLDLGRQFQVLRQSLSQHATVSANLLEELSLNLDLLDIKDKVYCDASTQTNLETKVIPAKTTPVYANVDSYESNEDSDLSLEEIQICLPLDDTSKLTAELRHKFRRLPALVKGYLLRRLLRTEKVYNLKRTILDTSILLLNFKSNLYRNGRLIVEQQDIFLHQRLCVQLEKACKDFYAIFFNTSISKQMEMISNHRVYLNQIKYLSEKRSGSVSSSASSLCRRCS